MKEIKTFKEREEELIKEGEAKKAEAEEEDEDDDDWDI